MPVLKRQFGLKLRVVDATTRRVAVNSKTGRPIDGGGWRLQGRPLSMEDQEANRKADKQVGILNEWAAKQNGTGGLK